MISLKTKKSSESQPRSQKVRCFSLEIIYPRLFWIVVGFRIFRTVTKNVGVEKKHVVKGHEKLAEAQFLVKKAQRPDLYALLGVGSKASPASLPSHKHPATSTARPSPSPPG